MRLLGAAFLALLAIVTAEATQAVGALLLLGLIAAPAGAAHQLTTQPLHGIALSGAFAVLAMWVGLALSYAIPLAPAEHGDHRRSPPAPTCSPAAHEARKASVGLSRAAFAAG